MSLTYSARAQMVPTSIEFEAGHFLLQSFHTNNFGGGEGIGKILCGTSLVDCDMLKRGTHTQIKPVDDIGSHDPFDGTDRTNLCQCFLVCFGGSEEPNRAVLEADCG